MGRLEEAAARKLVDLCAKAGKVAQAGEVDVFEEFVCECADEIGGRLGDGPGDSRQIESG